MDNTLIFGILIIAFVLFLVFREVACWYWKMNKVVKLLERIAHDLEAKP